MNSDIVKLVRVIAGYPAFIIVLLVSSPGCQDSRDDSGWPLSQYDRGCDSLMHGLHQEWSSADGELTFVVARKMFWAVLLDPNAFYAEFDKDSTSMDRFVSDLDKLVFWNPSDTSTSALEAYRAVALYRLEETSYSIEDRYSSIHNALIERIRAAKVTHVD